MDSDNARQAGKGTERGSKLTMLGRRDGQWQHKGPSKAGQAAWVVESQWNMEGRKERGSKLTMQGRREE